MSRLEKLDEMLEACDQAILDVLAGKTVTFNGRSVTRESLSEIRLMRKALQEERAMLIKSPRLQLADPKSWYLINKQAIEVSYLDGVESPYIEQQQGFNIDGVTTKVRIDAGVNVIDYRGIVKVTNA